MPYVVYWNVLSMMLMYVCVNLIYLSSKTKFHPRNCRSQNPLLPPAGLVPPLLLITVTSEAFILLKSFGFSVKPKYDVIKIFKAKCSVPSIIISKYLMVTWTPNYFFIMTIFL
ncbi:hypothetical protein MOUN0_F03664 [Monosporozyma unispora]